MGTNEVTMDVSVVGSDDTEVRTEVEIDVSVTGSGTTGVVFSHSVVVVGHGVQVFSVVEHEVVCLPPQFWLSSPRFHQPSSPGHLQSEPPPQCLSATEMSESSRFHELSSQLPPLPQVATAAPVRKAWSISVDDFILGY